MSIRMKLANWLSGGELTKSQSYGARMKDEVQRLRDQRNRLIEQYSSAMCDPDPEAEKLRDALKRIYDTPCGPHSNGSQRKIRRIAAHALWKE